MVTPNFCTSSSSLLSTLLTATFSYCSRSSATCKRPRRQAEGSRDFFFFLEVLSIPIPPWPHACQEEKATPRGPPPPKGSRSCLGAGDKAKASCTHLSAHKGVALLEDQRQVLLGVPLEEAVNLLRAAREERGGGGGALQVAPPAPPGRFAPPCLRVPVRRDRGWDTDVAPAPVPPC